MGSRIIYKNIFLLFFVFLIQNLNSQDLLRSKINEQNPKYFNFSPDSRKFDEITDFKSQKLNDGSRFYKSVTSGEYDNGVIWIRANYADIIRDSKFIFPSINGDKVAMIMTTREVTSSYIDDVSQYWDSEIAGYFDIQEPEKKFTNETIEIIASGYLEGPKVNVTSAYLFNLTYDKQPIKLYTGYVQDTDTIRNRRGQVRNIKKGSKYGFTAMIPIGEKKMTSISDVSGNKIGRGFLRAYLRSDIGKYVENETWERYSKNPDFTIANYSSVWFDIEDGDDPNSFIETFSLISLLFYDMFGVPGIGDVTFTELDDKIIALALGINDNCSVKIAVDINKWNKSTYLQKYHIMFHELGHDIFNLGHNDGIRLMATNQFNIESDEELGEMIHEMLYHVAKNYDVVGIDATSFKCEESQ